MANRLSVFLRTQISTVLSNGTKMRTYSPSNRCSSSNDRCSRTSSWIVTNEVSREPNLEVLNALKILNLLVGQMDRESFDIGLQMLDFTSTNNWEDVWSFLREISEYSQPGWSIEKESQTCMTYAKAIV
jgi:hypothetical protein